jgi:tetratricopeptide (TPR) repeat protein
MSLIWVVGCNYLDIQRLKSINIFEINSIKMDASLKKTATTCVLVYLTLGLHALCQPVAPQPTPDLAQARALLQSGRSNDAEKSVRQYLNSNKDSADAHYLLGQILFAEQKAKESLAEYTEAAKYRKPTAFDLKVVSLDYVLLHDYTDADKWLTRSVEMDPGDQEAWYYLGRAKYSENRFQEAIRAFKQCLKFNAKNVKAEDNIGLSYEGLGQTQDALTAFQTAIAWQAESPIKNVQPYIHLGSLLLEQNRIQESLTYLRQAIEIAPNESKAHEQLGKAYLQLHQFKDAQSELERATELAPQNAPLHFELGQVYRKLGMMEKAKAEFDRYSALSEKESPPQIAGPQ